MDFTININLVFIDSMHFMSSSLGALVKTFSDNDFKYLTVYCKSLVVNCYN